MSSEQIARDFRSAARIFLNAPDVSLGAVVVIALIVGANTTVYSIVHGLTSKPAPEVRAERLVMLEALIKGEPIGPTSYPDYQDFAAAVTTISPLVAYGAEQITLQTDAGSYAIVGELVTDRYFEAVGVTLERGRVFSERESQLNSSGLVAIISHRLWQAQFDGADDIIGTSLVLSGRPAEVIGIAPRRFHGPKAADATDVWVPMQAYARLQGLEELLADRTAEHVEVLGRLAAGQEFNRAAAEVDAISSRLQTVFPEANKEEAVRLVRYSPTSSGSLVAQGAGRFMTIFRIVTCLTLLIGCANVANLLLARALVQHRDLAVRQALGASRHRIVRLLVAESVVLSIAAVIIGYLFAAWASNAALQLVPPDPRGVSTNADFSPDWQVFGYAMALAVVATVAFSVAPAILTSRTDLLASLRSSEHSIRQSRSGVSRGLTVLQLACAVLLLTCATLAYRSLSLIDDTQMGFRSDGVLLTTISTATATDSEAANAVALKTLAEHFRAVPGVQTVAFATRPPQELWPLASVRIEGLEEPVRAERAEVSPEYFGVLGISALAGRLLTEEDRSGASRAVVISQNLAERLWPGDSALGRNIEIGRNQEAAQVVGIVRNGYYGGFRHVRQPAFVFLSAAQQRIAPGEMTFYLRYDRGLDGLGGDVRRALRTADARVPIVYMRAMERQLDNITWLPRALTTLVTLFAVGAIAVAAVGQYAVTAFTTRKRLHEFGVRIALGATPRRILVSVLRQGLLLTAIGLAIGFGASVATLRIFGSLLYGVSPTDLRTYAAVVVMLSVISLMACYLPAKRAAGADPIDALRQE